MALKVVVLPAPVGPNKTKNSPSFTVKVMLSKALTVLSKILVTPWSSTVDIRK